MSRFLRMIASIERWDGTKVVNRDNAFLSGDIIADLRTTDNKLSVWKADTQEDINDAVVALALGKDRLSKINYILIEKKDLDKMGINVSECLGDVKGVDEKILSKHGDLVELDFWTLGFLAENMANSAKDEKRRTTKTKKDVEKLLNEYKKNNKIKIDEIKQNLKDSLNW